MHAIWVAYWTQWFMQNVLPPSFWTLLGLAISHIHLRRHVSRKNEEIKDHIRGIMQ